MKKIEAIIICLIWSISLKAQTNLVPNPSFEVYDTCPDFASQINRAVGWYAARPTPDYFNLCSPGVSWCSVPINYFGYRTPSSGNAYAGAITSSGSEERELIGCQLISSLQIGTKYYGSFKVSLGGQASPLNYCGTNKLGILFSTVRYDRLLFAPICSNCAQICSDTIVTDTLNWTRITGSFIADSSYSFICIGRFNFNSLTDFIQVTGFGHNAYYYIDDICVSTDSAYTYNYTYTGIKEKINFPVISVYPNPANDYINIDFTFLHESYTIWICDALGREVFLKQNVINPIEHIPIGNFNSNIIFIKIFYEEKTFNYKIIKLKQ